MHVDPSTKPSNGGGLSQSTPTCTTGPKRPSMELSTDQNTIQVHPIHRKPSRFRPLSLSLIFDGRLTVLLSSVGDFVGVNLQRQGTRRGPTSYSDGEGPKIPDPKTLRRLAHNREAARKSMLRKKIESSRIKLTQSEQELQRARTQIMIIQILHMSPSLRTEGYIFWRRTRHSFWCDKHKFRCCCVRLGACKVVGGAPQDNLQT